MIGTFFVSLFKINEQADHYRLQAAKINEARHYFSPRYRRQVKAMKHFSDAARYLGNSMKDFEKGCARLAVVIRKQDDAIRNGLTELSKERSN